MIRDKRKARLDTTDMTEHNLLILWGMLYSSTESKILLMSFLHFYDHVLPVALKSNMPKASEQSINISRP